MTRSSDGASFDQAHVEQSIEHLTVLERRAPEAIEDLSHRRFTVDGTENAQFLVREALLITEVGDGERVAEEHVGEVEAVFDESPLVDATKAFHDQSRRVQAEARLSRELALGALHEAKSARPPAHHL